jgi:hypothetical protein
MVRAILSGRKTQTRRVVKRTDSGRVKAPGSAFNWHLDDSNATLACPYGQPGDRLWVRETWQAIKQDKNGISYMLADPADESAEIRYRATDETFVPPLPWRPSIFMRHRMSRITLEVTDIRVERLQRISPADCDAEGIERSACHTRDGAGCNARINDYKALWTSINGPDSWGANPYVWVVGFKMLIPI